MENWCHLWVRCWLWMWGGMTVDLPPLSHSYTPDFSAVPSAIVLTEGWNNQRQRTEESILWFWVSKTLALARTKYLEETRSVRRKGFATSPRLDKDSLDFSVGTWGADSTGEKTRHSTYPQEFTDTQGRYIQQTKVIKWIDFYDTTYRKGTQPGLKMGNDLTKKGIFNLGLAA